jgi:hypothetical protein
MHWTPVVGNFHPRVKSKMSQHLVVPNPLDGMECTLKHFVTIKR